MNHRYVGSMGLLALVAALVSPAAVVPVTGQSQAGARKAPTTTSAQTRIAAAPRTLDGQPDLQGVWTFATVTPLERPSELAGKEVLTQEEAETFAKESERRNNQDPKEGVVETRVVPYNDFWYDRGKNVVKTRRTSLIVDPPDGRLPPLTPAAQEKVKDAEKRRNRPAAGPEDRSLAERCIVGLNAGPPMIPAAYNQNIQLFQGPGYVVILNEMIHNARIVPLDKRPHVNKSIRQLSGDSRGRWEDNTLVVETTNFPDMRDWPRVVGGISEQLQLTERFTRVDADTLLYEMTVNDPKTFTRPWTAQLPMTKIQDHLYEYACHEGNYGLEGILVGARADEKAAEQAAKKGSR